MMEERKVSESKVEITRLVRPNHLNSAGRLFGGMLMSGKKVAELIIERLK